MALHDTCAHQLSERGFAVIEGPYSTAQLPFVADAYENAVATADPTDIRISSSSRVWDIVSRTTAFQDLYLHPPLLQACRLVVGESFKLSATCFRAVEPGARSQQLHTDVRFGADGWPILGFIYMVDPFTAENGATRFVPGSHRRPFDPGTHPAGPGAGADEEVLAAGPAGAMVIFNGSTWHGHSANTSPERRRSIQGHFIQRHGKAALDYGARLAAGRLASLSAAERYVLGLTDARPEIALYPAKQ